MHSAGLLLFFTRFNIIKILKRIVLSFSLRYLFAYLMTFITPWLSILAFIDLSWLTLAATPFILEDRPRSYWRNKELPHRPISEYTAHKSREMSGLLNRSNDLMTLHTSKLFNNLDYRYKQLKLLGMKRSSKEV